MSERLSKYYCERCGEQYPEMEDGEFTFFEIHLRPYDLFCSAYCVDRHIQEIEGGEWSDWGTENKGLENFYADEIKNNWVGYPYKIVSADNLKVIEESHIKAEEMNDEKI